MKHLLAMLAHRERLRILRKTRDGIVAKVLDGQVFPELMTLRPSSLSASAATVNGQSGWCG